MLVDWTGLIHLFGAEVLAEIPEQLLGFMASKGIVPGTHRGGAPD